MNRKELKMIRLDKNSVVERIRRERKNGRVD